jgi:malonyl-CoA decarboxylase
MSALSATLRRCVGGALNKSDLSVLQSAPVTAFNDAVDALLGANDAELESLLRVRAAVASDAELKPLHRRLGVAMATSFEEPRLELRRVTTRSVSGDVLARVMRSSATLYAIANEREASTRFDGEFKRAFGLFHRAIAWPLVVVEVSLVNCFADRLAPLVRADAAWHADPTSHAILYSIISQEAAALTELNVGRTLVRSVLNAVQPGVLRNRVVVRLDDADRRRLDQIKVVSTLSPVNAFERFMQQQQQQQQQQQLSRSDALSRYILRAPLDQRCPVSKFHLGNGARVERLLLDGNDLVTPTRPMVNYRYIASEMDSNAFNFEFNGIVATALKR